MISKITPNKLKDFGFLNHMGPERAIIESTIEHEFVKQSCYVDNLEHPQQSILILPFIAFLFGNPALQTTSDLLELIPEKVDIYAPTIEWKEQLHNHFGEKLRKKRTSQFMNNFNLSIDEITSMKQPLPDEYSLQQVGKKDLANMEDELNFHVSMLFGDIETFLEYGIGFCILHQDKPISFASSFLPYTDKLEITIATIDSENYRRKGFATQTSLALIDYCVNNGIEPYWSAMNEPSLKLAKKLGFSKPTPYDVYGWIDQ